MRYNKTKDRLELWEIATNNIKDVFVAKYFGKDTSDVYWIADDIGGVLAVNDFFFSLNDIIDYLKYNYSSKRMFEHYYYSLDCHNMNEHPINIKNYKKIKK